MSAHPIPHRGTLSRSSVLPHAARASEPTTAEALRRATTDTPPVAHVLRKVADRLTHVHPHLPMTEAALLIATQRATDPRDLGPCAAGRLAARARALAPTLDRPITRGEYALLLRAAARSLR